jgi:hypothetical protein
VTGTPTGSPPSTTRPGARGYLTQLAAAADARRDQLAQEVVDDQPQWAIEALGPVPADDRDREQWLQRAGAVAAHRELSGHDDPATAIAGPPKAGQVEAYASWRSAWHALGRPEADRDEAEMSDGQLLVRVRAYQREQNWAPPYVANELAGTRQAAERHRATATLRRHAAEATSDAEHRARLQREAVEAEALTKLLDRQATQLAEADDARAHWYAHTAATRAAADRAQAEIAQRRTTRGEDLTPARVTAQEHLAARDQADDHLEITDETDLTDIAAQRETDRRAVDRQRHHDAAETGLTDIRDAARDPRRGREDQVRVPTADETTDALRRAHRALAEIRARDTDDTRAAEDARTEQLARWHQHDRAVEQGAADEHGWDRSA